MSSKVRPLGTSWIIVSSDYNKSEHCIRSSLSSPRANLLTVLAPGVDPYTLPTCESVSCHADDFPHRSNAKGMQPFSVYIKGNIECLSLFDDIESRAIAH